jgi:hypothetical protein
MVLHEGVQREFPWNMVNEAAGRLIAAEVLLVRRKSRVTPVNAVYVHQLFLDGM